MFEKPPSNPKMDRIGLKLIPMELDLKVYCLWILLQCVGYKSLCVNGNTNKSKITRSD